MKKTEQNKRLSDKYFINKGNLEAGASVHDPMLFTEGKGKYFLVCHGSDISGEIHVANEIIIEGGEVKELNIKIPEKSRAIFRQTDEAGNDIITLSWVSENKSFWAVKYNGG